jgi:hypothetical protein
MGTPDDGVKSLRVSRLTASFLGFAAVSLALGFRPVLFFIGSSLSSVVGFERSP